MKMKGKVLFLIGAVFVMLVLVSMTMTGCAVQQRTTHEDKAQKKMGLGGLLAPATTHDDKAQPPQPVKDQPGGYK
ncbi:MAG: hypothetical protein Q8P28_10980 [Deltaproteobacteria bacterium]|nr:hypothetical protein [Deltaproteobacteria bacterium]